MGRIDMPPIDPRSVANEILKLAKEYDFTVTQLSLQKILYFIHGRYLIENDIALVSGTFEAWQYGPVHPVIYSAFKKFGSKNIDEPAKSKDLLTGFETDIVELGDKNLVLFIRENAARYLKLSPGRLIELSHAPGSPWDQATKVGGDRQFGMRISNEQIKNLFRYHKISIGSIPRSGEPNEESVPA